MSREFSWVEAGYMHTQLTLHAENCLGGEEEGDEVTELTRLLGGVLRPLAGVAYGVCSVEASDANLAGAVGYALRNQEELRNAMKALDRYLDTYREVARGLQDD